MARAQAWVLAVAAKASAVAGGRLHADFGIGLPAVAAEADMFGNAILRFALQSAEEHPQARSS